MLPPDGLPTKPDPKKPGRRKLSGSLLALGSAAVVSIYTVGYASTRSSLDDLTAQVETPIPTSTATQRANRPAASGTPRPAPTQAPATSPVSGKYADGTYTGTGTSRHGNITVTVVIKGGQITSAAVTNCATRYPCSDVNPLVSAVLTNQQVPTNHVSGATDSSTAYKTAVTRALQQAQAGV
jgi:uncharacterized protein with FMN-binding domain